MADGDSSGRRWGSLPLHSLLIATLPVLWIHRTNLQSLYVDMLLRPLLLYLLLAATILGVLRLATGGWRRGAPAATGWTLLLLYGGALGGAGATGIAVLALGLTVAGRRWARPWPSVGVLMNVAVLFLVAFNLYQNQAQARAVLSPEIRPGYLDDATVRAWTAAESDPARLPDIYYLVLDGMARLDVLEQLYGVDGAELRLRLRNLGFTVAERSYANYPQTALSIAASLNGGPLDDFLRFPHPNSRDRRPLGDTISHSRVGTALAHHGYRVISYPSGYPFTRITTSDETRGPWLSPNLAEFYLLNETLLTPLQQHFAAGPSELSFALRRRQLRHVFDDLPRLARQRSDAPRFVFAHILAPHPPFVFGRSGQALSSRAAFSYRDGDHWDEIHAEGGYRSLYRDQALYTLDRLLDAVQQLLADSSRPAVIIVQGDHGPGSELTWSAPTNRALQERLAIFNAYRVPEGWELSLYDGITPVNSFRKLLDALLGTTVPPAEDRVFYSSIGRPYSLRDLGVLGGPPSPSP